MRAQECKTAPPLLVSYALVENNSRTLLHCPSGQDSIIKIELHHLIIQLYILKSRALLQKLYEKMTFSKKIFVFEAENLFYISNVQKILLYIIEKRRYLKNFSS